MIIFLRDNNLNVRYYLTETESIAAKYENSHK